jgi:hypothetical protein
MFLYVGGHMSPVQSSALKRLAVSRSFVLQVRDDDYVEFRNNSDRPKAFICHDSRNKKRLVRPLAHELQKMLCPVWYDEFSLKPGDSLREGIDRGLRDSPKCIVVLSRQFMSNPGWTKGEFNAIVTRHFSEGESILIPIWHRVSRSAVREYSPLVVDIIALNSKVGIQELARQVFQAVA